MMEKEEICITCQKNRENPPNFCPDCGKSARETEDFLPQLLSRVLCPVDENGQANYVPLRPNHVIIPQGAKSLREYAFSSYPATSTGIVKITLPTTLADIEKGCFYGNLQLKTVHIHENVEYIEALAFAYCDLGELTFPPVGQETKLCGIGEQAFVKSRVETVDFPPSLEFLGYGAMAHCSQLRQVNLAGKLQFLPDMAFYHCEKLKEVTLSTPLKTIGASAFACSGLEKIVIPDSVESLGSAAFRGCRQLKEVVLPPNLQRISRLAFADCEQLEVVNIPPSVQYVDNYAFLNCRSLKEVTATENMIFESMMFTGCDHLENLYLEGETLDMKGKSLLSAGENLTNEEKHSINL